MVVAREAATKSFVFFFLPPSVRREVKGLSELLLLLRHFSKKKLPLNMFKAAGANVPGRRTEDRPRDRFYPILVSSIPDPLMSCTP